jgi:hypothetical protein
VLASVFGTGLLAKETCGHLADDGSRIYGQQIAHDLTAQLGLFTTPEPC